MKFSNTILFFIYFICIVILSYLIPIWYAFVVLLVILSFFFSSEDTKAFLLGFISVFLAWTFIMIFIDTKNDSILSQKVTELFKLPSKWMLIFITALIGAILGGLATWVGKNLKSSFALLK